MSIVISIKLGVNKSGEDAAAVSLRDTKSGEVTSFKVSGSKELVGNLFRYFESNPDIKIKYE